MTDTYVVVREPDGTEKKIRNVSNSVGGSTVHQQVTTLAKDDGTIIAAATEGKQDTANTSLSSIDTKTPALGQAVAAASVPVVLTAAQVSTLTPPAAITGFATSAKQDTLQASTGATTDAEAASGDGTVIAILKACRTKLASIVTAVTGTLTVGLPSGASTLAEQQAQTTAAGSLTETAPATDTASSGLNGRLQRIAQRITSLIALLPTSLAAGGGLKVEGVAGGVALPMSATMKEAPGSSSAVTISPASLASDANFLAGVESDAIDNTTTKARDYSVSGKITVGTSPTTGKEIRVGVIGIMDDSHWPDVFDGTASAETISTAGSRDSIVNIIASIATVATSDQTYYWSCRSIRAAFGGLVPKNFVFFLTHNTGVNLNSTAGNHAIYITPQFDGIV